LCTEKNTLTNVKLQSTSLAYTISKEMEEMLSELSEEHSSIDTKALLKQFTVTRITMPVNLKKLF